MPYKRAFSTINYLKSPIQNHLTEERIDQTTFIFINRKHLYNLDSSFTTLNHDEREVRLIEIEERLFDNMPEDVRVINRAEEE